MATEEIVLAEHQALVVKPGDKVLLSVKDGYRTDPAHTVRLVSQLKERWPDVEFTILFGARVEAVYRAS